MEKIDNVAPAAGKANDAERAAATSNAALNKMINGIKTSAVKLNEEIHAAALFAMQHALDFGDATGSARLVDALPVSHRRSLLINWFKTFSPITIGKDGKTELMKAHLAGKAEERVWQMAEAKATPFYAMPEAKREPDVPTYESWHNNVLAFTKRSKALAEKIENPDEKARALAEITVIERAIPTAENELAALRAEVAALKAAQQPVQQAAAA